MQPLAELKLEAEAETQPELLPVIEPEPEAKPILPQPKQKAKLTNRLRNCAKDNEDLIQKDWGMENNFSSKKSFATSKADKAEIIDDTTLPVEFFSITDGIEIPNGTVINTNTIWDSNVHLLGTISVENAMLVIKPGVRIKSSNGYIGGIIVRNNGCLIANGTPEDRILFSPDHWIPWPYAAYGFAIKLEKTASSLCEISYCAIGNAYIGILSLNKRIESPIHDNRTLGCVIGIAQDGPMLTDVVNNELIGTYYIGIGANLADVCGVASNATEIYIGNNTISGGWGDLGWNQVVGIYVSGVENPYDAGVVTIANNLIAGCADYGIYQVNGWMRTLVAYNGYLGNYRNINGSEEGGEAAMVSAPEYGEISKSEPVGTIDLLSGDSNDYNSVTIENFNSYATSAALQTVWNDYIINGTASTVSLESLIVRDGKSMWYRYENYEWPEYELHYAEARADVGNLPSGIGRDWTIGDYNTLTLYFYGQVGNDSNEQMYVKLTDGDEEQGVQIVDNFNSYATSAALLLVWNDFTINGTASTVSLESLIGRDGNSMGYKYENFYPPYYAESTATTTALDINDPNWSGQRLSLWFYGQSGNDANERMYIKLTDKTGQTSKVMYDGEANDVRETEWHLWEIDTERFELANFDFDITRVAKITIGFGDGIAPAGSGTGTVYFEDIRLYFGEPDIHSAQVAYDGRDNYLSGEWWNVWNIPLTEFADINLANVKMITIGFGDGTSPGDEPNGLGWVCFDDITLGNRKADKVDPFNYCPVYLYEDPFVNGYGHWPVYIRQDCPLIDAGGGYIDEYRGLIGKTTDVNSFPDSNVVDIGYHYMDWSYVNAGDGNVLSADLNEDDVVNFEDFAVLADYWQQATTEAADIDESGFVDYNDMDILADEWMEIAEPNILLEITGDGNNGYVEVGASGYTSDTQRVFLLADGQYIKEISGAKNGYTLGFDVSEFGDGERQFKAISIDSGCRVTCSNINNVEFSCPLNYCFMPSTYEPNKPLYFSAFNPSGGDVTVKVYVDCNLVWSQSYIGDSFFDSIPTEFTGQYYFDYVSFDTGGGGMLKAGGNEELLDAENEVSITKTTGPVESPETNVQALIILPDPYMEWINMRNILAVQNAFKNRGIKYKKLKGISANYDTIASYAGTNPIKYIYVDGHGSFKLFNGALRTNVDFPDDVWMVSIKKSDFTNQDDAPSWCKDLGGFWEDEERTKSFYSMGFAPIKLAYFYSCYSGRLKINSNNELIEGQPGQEGIFDMPQSDMSIALGMDEPWNSHLYQGWYGIAKNRSIQESETEYQKWTRLEWERLGEGDNILEALMYVISQQTQAGPKDPINNFRLKGHGWYFEIVLGED